jgi:Uma2 family endonuclease
MGETDFHIFAVILLREALEDYLAGRPDAYVASTMILYFDRGNPSGRRDPDVLVALGVGRQRRRSFRTWEEGAVPSVLFEVSSEGTYREDLGEKRSLYERLGVPEYFLFDPEGQWLRPVLQGFRLAGGAYAALPPAPDGSLRSAQLGLRLVPEGTRLRLVDACTGAPVPTRAERIEHERQRAEAERQRADAERHRAAGFAAEVERLRALRAQGQRPPE